MAKSKEEIEYSIRELQAQYEALIAEGSYKLADQRLKRIKELTQQLKTMKDTHTRYSHSVVMLPMLWVAQVIRLNSDVTLKVMKR